MNLLESSGVSLQLWPGHQVCYWEIIGSWMGKVKEAKFGLAHNYASKCVYCNPSKPLEREHMYGILALIIN